MQTVKIITLEKDNRPVVWATTNQLKHFVNFVDYVVNNLDHPEDFYIWDSESNKIYKLVDEYRYLKGGQV